MNKTSARILAVGLPLAVVAATGAAFAYWSGAASGSATGTAADGVAPVALVTKTPVTGLVPGGSVEVAVKANNPNQKTSVSISTLTAGAVTSDKAGCTLVISGATATATAPLTPVVVPAAGSADFGKVTVSMENSDTVNQDACKGASFTVALTAA